ncbi:MAG: hypothetical protein Ct9H300mP12_01970 [Acidimicrobiales bacterium]|nr:MAG: hypothetical protein Ct9H300mP12_01970 [Acidimicrobiales bacterium]
MDGRPVDSSTYLPRGLEEDLFPVSGPRCPLMAEFSFLSEEWIERWPTEVGLPERVGLDGVVRFVMTSTPHGKVQFRLVVADGRISEVMVGRDGEAEATVTLGNTPMRWLSSPASRADVAFMTGRCKVEDAYARYVFDLRPVFGSPDGVNFWPTLGGRSDF